MECVKEGLERKKEQSINQSINQSMGFAVYDGESVVVVLLSWRICGFVFARSTRLLLGHLLL
jgi:hypothetical protein